MEVHAARKSQDDDEEQEAEDKCVWETIMITPLPINEISIPSK